jgi:indolepyruvate ferredoxin oxidoreductase
MGMRDKLTLGRWFAPVLGVLYRARSLRGTRLDVFGYAHVRRVERRLVEEYIDTVRAALAVLDATTYDTAVRLASLPDGVRGYEDVKLRSVAAYSTARAALLTELGLTADPAVRRQSNHRPRHADNRSR